MTDQPVGPTAVHAATQLKAWLDEHGDDLYGPNALEHATRDDLAEVCAALAHVTTILSTLASVAQTDLAALMESDTENIGHWTVKRTRSMKTEWNAPAWRAAVRERAVEQLAVNIETGEVVQPIKRAVMEAARVVFGCFNPSTAPSVTGLKALDIEPNEYRATTPGTWKITVQEAMNDE